MDRESWPFITVIVPVRNEAAYIEKTLTKLVTGNYPPLRYEILVIDGESEDDTVAIVERLRRRFPQIRCFRNPKRWSSAARNIGVREGRGDYFVIIDGHCDVEDPDYLRRLVEAFERTGADCLGRPQPLEVPRATPVQQAIALARRSWLGHNPSSYIYSSQGGFVEASSVAVAYRRSVFETIGLFDERFDACEDVEFNHRIDAAGLRCWFAPELAISYHPRRSIPALMKQMVRYGRGRIRLAFKHPEALTAPAVAPLLFFVTSLLCLLLGLWQREWTWLGAGLVAVYLSVVGLTSIRLVLQTKHWLVPLWLPTVFLAVHLGFAWGTWRELVAQSRRIVSRAWRRRPVLRPVAAWPEDRAVDSSPRIVLPPAARLDTPATDQRAAA
jgi:GT2 family glycosyltransferase